MGKFSFSQGKIFFQKDSNAIEKKKYLFKFLVLVFFLSSHVSAQVIIKEKVEINPQGLILPDAPNSNSHTIRVEVDWDAQEEQANGHFWDANLQVNTQLTNNCDQMVGATGFVYGWPTGSSVLDIQNANAYYYTLRVTLTGFYGAYQFVDVNYRFYLDDELLHSGLIEAMSGQDYTWTVTRYYERTHYVFLLDFLDFKINTYNYPVEYESNYNLYINPGNSCSSANVVSLTDEVNLSIIKGSQYLTFFQSQTEDTLGSSTQTILSDLSNIQIIYNKPLRDTLDTLGVIMIEGNGLIEYDSVIIKPALFDLIVETDPKIIAPGDTAIVTVKRRTDYGTEEFISDQSFDVWIIDGSNYGFLLDSLTDNSLKGIPNRFRIVANDSIDVDSTKIVIKVITETGNISARLTKNNVNKNEEDKIENSNVNDKEKEPIQTEWIVFGETLEGYGNVVVKVNPFIVEIDPPTISAGDTARIIPKKLNPDGTTTPFDSLQTFELGMLDGCQLGYMRTAIDSNNYFYGVTQPFYFIADTSADSGSVNIRVGIIDMNQQNRSLNNNNPIENDNPVSCANINFVENLYVKANVVLGGCKQKTIICNNYQPPKFENVSAISILEENKPWNWKGEKGKNQNTSTGDACNYQMTSACSDIMFGQTYIMPKIGDFASGTPPPPIYNRLDDMKIVVCLDKTDPNHHYWNFSIENLRVPIFTSHCPDQPATCNYIDLGDGTNIVLLAQHIKNCTDYNKVMHVLKDYWSFGPERIGGLPYEKYYFSAGVIDHENHHLDQIEKYLPLILNSIGGLKQLANKRLEKNSQYKCPEDALNAKKQEIKDLINDFLYMINDLKTLMNKNNTEKYISEIEADKVASLEYEKIKTRIQNWASQQSWWCELRPIGIIGTPTFLDCGLIPCNP